jgi:hypothetical protein
MTTFSRHEPRTTPGWLSGWTFVPAAPALFRETTAPLIVTTFPGPAVECTVSHASQHVVFPHHESAEALIYPWGFRLRCAMDDDEALASLVRMDAGTALLECDVRLAPEPEGDFKPAGTGATDRVAEERLADQALLTLTRVFDHTMRIVWVAGVGSTQALLARARALMDRGAHRELDRLVSLYESPARGAHTPPPALDYLISRLRPATTTLAYPWLADAEGEPVWDLAQLYPAVCCLIEAEPAIAVGLVQNVLDHLGADGSLPVAGGHVSPIFRGLASAPLLIRTVTACFHKTGQWPGDLSSLIPRCARYLVAQGSGQAPDPVSEHRHPIIRLALRQEIVLWHDMRSRSADPAPGEPDTLRLIGEQTLGGRLGHPVVAALMNPSDHRTLRRIAPSDLLEAADTWMNDTTVPAVTRRALFRVMYERLAGIDPGRAAAWVHQAPHLHDAPATWLPTEPGESLHHDRDQLAAALTAAWTCTVPVPNPRARLSLATRTARWLNMRPRALAWVIALCLLATAAGLFSVQFRDTMPPRVFETRLGMAMQYYRDGSYDQAAAVVDEMRARGHKTHPHLIALAGRIEYHRGNLRAAETLFSNLVERRSDDPVPAYNLALIRFEQGHHKEATSRFDTIATEFSASHPSLAQRAAAAAALSREVAGEPDTKGK